VRAGAGVMKTIWEGGGGVWLCCIRGRIRLKMSGISCKISEGTRKEMFHYKVDWRRLVIALTDVA